MAAELTAEAFAMAQQAQEGRHRRGAGRMATLAAGDDVPAQRLRERSDLLERVGAVNHQLSDALASQGVRSPPRGCAPSSTRRAGALVELDRRSPRVSFYRRLISAEGVSLGEIQRALATTRRCSTTIVGGRESFVFVVRRDRTPPALDIDAARLEQHVRALRQGVNPDGVELDRDLPRFDLAARLQLYQAISRRRWTTSLASARVHRARRALQSLRSTAGAAPPARDWRGGTRHASDAGASPPTAAAWLTRRLATSTLPSPRRCARCASWRGRRARAKRSSASATRHSPARSAARARSARHGCSCAAASERARHPELRRCPRPPASARARAHARRGDTALFLRDQATVRRVRATPLANYRVVAFRDPWPHRR